MTNGEAVNWLISISADIGKAEHRDLWHYEQALSDIRDMLESAQSEPHWIPCSERLPEYETDVLVTRHFLGWEDHWNNNIPPSTYVEVAMLYDDYWRADSDEYKIAQSKHTDPIAWMPLPEPYAERRTDDSR